MKKFLWFTGSIVVLLLMGGLLHRFLTPSMYVKDYNEFKTIAENSPYLTYYSQLDLNGSYYDQVYNRYGKFSSPAVISKADYDAEDFYYYETTYQNNLMSVPTIPEKEYFVIPYEERLMAYERDSQSIYTNQVGNALTETQFKQAPKNIYDGIFNETMTLLPTKFTKWFNTYTITVKATDYPFYQSLKSQLSNIKLDDQSHFVIRITFSDRSLNTVVTYRSKVDDIKVNITLTTSIKLVKPEKTDLTIPGIYYAPWDMQDVVKTSLSGDLIRPERDHAFIKMYFEEGFYLLDNFSHSNVYHYYDTDHHLIDHLRDNFLSPGQSLAGEYVYIPKAGLYYIEILGGFNFIANFKKVEKFAVTQLFQLDPWGGTMEFNPSSNTHVEIVSYRLEIPYNSRSYRYVTLTIKGLNENLLLGFNQQAVNPVSFPSSEAGIFHFAVLPPSYKPSYYMFNQLSTPTLAFDYQFIEFNQTDNSPLTLLANEGSNLMVMNPSQNQVQFTFTLTNDAMVHYKIKLSGLQNGGDFNATLDGSLIEFNTDQTVELTAGTHQITIQKTDSTSLDSVIVALFLDITYPE